MHVRIRVFGLVIWAAAVWGQATKTPVQLPSNLPPGLYAVIRTSMGDITAELFERETPNTVRNFIGLANGTRPWLDPKTRDATTRPLYDNITFHRVVPNFMIQTGDPTGTGRHNCGFVIKDEIVPSLRFDRPGRLAMANIGHPNTGACQFFITESLFSNGNGRYTIFGQVVGGMKLIGQIARVKRGARDKPKEPVMLNHIYIARLVEKVLPGHTDSGFGVYVNPRGDILTSSDVVQGCNEVHLTDGRKLDLAATDPHNGLAALRSGSAPGAFAMFRKGEDVSSQEPVWTLGTSPSFVSAAVDSHGDARFLQVYGAPAGTRGTPVLDTGGTIAGILTETSGTAGSLLAIKASVALGFLDSANIPYSAQPTGGAANRNAAVDNARAYTVLLQCWK